MLTLSAIVYIILKNKHMCTKNKQQIMNRRVTKTGIKVCTYCNEDIYQGMDVCVTQFCCLCKHTGAKTPESVNQYFPKQPLLTLDLSVGLEKGLKLFL